MFNAGVFLSVLALDAWLWWRYDWRAGVAAIAISALSYLLGNVLLRKQIEAEGYAVEYKPDARGKKRWRIGIKKKQKVTEADIQWIPPTGG